MNLDISYLHGGRIRLGECEESIEKGSDGREEKGEGKKDLLSSGNPFESVPKYQLYSLNRSSVRWDEVISADVIGK